MTEEDKTTANEKIFNAAVTLFAQRGYSAVGVREIAANAEVNISMISYYFGGKVGLLKEIIGTFYERYLEILTQTVDDSLAIEQQARKTIGGIIDFFRSDPSLCKVGITEMPYDVEDVNTLRSEKIKRIKKLIFDKYFLGNAGFDSEDNQMIAIVSPAFISVIYSNFLLGPIVKNFTGVQFDDRFFEQYKEIVTDFILGGITRVLTTHKVSKENVK